MVCGFAWEGKFSLGVRVLPVHTVDYDPFIDRQLASRNQLEGLTWCKFGHATVDIATQRNPHTPPRGKGTGKARVRHGHA